MSEPDAQDPPASRFAPARLRAAALREEIEATRADLGATVAELGRQDHEPGAGDPEGRESPARVGASRGPRLGSSKAPLPIAAAAITVAAGLGAGLLVRRR